MPNYIYALLCPQGEIRYIGKTTNPEARLAAHISRAKTGETKHHAANWIRSLLKAGEKPAIEIVFEVPPDEPWEPYEIRLIAEFKAEGHRLTNSTGGGDGFFDVSPEAIAKRVAAAKITKSSPEYKKRIAALMMEVRSCPEWKKRASESTRKAWENESTRANMLAGTRHPDALRKRSEASIKRFTDPLQREAQADRAKLRIARDPVAFKAFHEAAQTPKAKAKRRASLDKAQSTPEYKAKNMAALAEIKERPEVKAKKSKASKANYGKTGLLEVVQSDEFKADQAERLKGRWKDPEAKAKMHEARWTDEHRAAQAAALEARREKMAAAMTPEVRAKQGAKMKEYWARKRAEKAAILAATTATPYTESS